MGMAVLVALFSAHAVSQGRVVCRHRIPAPAPGKVLHAAARRMVVVGRMVVDRGLIGKAPTAKALNYHRGTLWQGDRPCSGQHSMSRGSWKVP